MNNLQPINEKGIILLTEHLHDTKHKVNAVLVAKSKRTGTDYTYKIVAYTKNHIRFFSIALENNYNDFTICYMIVNKASKYSFNFKNNTSEIYLGAVWILNKFYEKNTESLLNKIEFYHTDKCIKCNRPLTDLDSIKFGMGKYCRSL